MNDSIFLRKIEILSIRSFDFMKCSCKLASVIIFSILPPIGVIIGFALATMLLFVWKVHKISGGVAAIVVILLVLGIGLLIFACIGSWCGDIGTRIALGVTHLVFALILIILGSILVGGKETIYKGTRSIFENPLEGNNYDKIINIESTFSCCGWDNRFPHCAFDEDFPDTCHEKFDYILTQYGGIMAVVCFVVAIFFIAGGVLAIVFRTETGQEVPINQSTPALHL
ncbi:hypothetical protein TRFO_14952 [Tritrichomonas foetus]|uniref:Tetraspanin family protein n=1 Tax=Tritrichomonas foetus TaxID=1144522 RepID=A0A1J4KTR1_9EUKA|nr:hypothetical protein TRFO_14952 [Tritrichomonas foetus]|eukprot:OHT14647.1 hypothetical protein TRFO_14952 [Tritrichomonas foetus]